MHKTCLSPARSGFLPFPLPLPVLRPASPVSCWGPLEEATYVTSASEKTQTLDREVKPVVQLRRKTIKDAYFYFYWHV